MFSAEVQTHVQAAIEAVDREIAATETALQALLKQRGLLNEALADAAGTVLPPRMVASNPIHAERYLKMRDFMRAEGDATRQDVVRALGGSSETTLYLEIGERQGLVRKTSAKRLPKRAKVNSRVSDVWEWVFEGDQLPPSPFNAEPVAAEPVAAPGQEEDPKPKQRRTRRPDALKPGDAERLIFDLFVKEGGGPLAQHDVCTKLKMKSNTVAYAMKRMTERTRKRPAVLEPVPGKPGDAGGNGRHYQLTAEARALLAHADKREQVPPRAPGAIERGPLSEEKLIEMGTKFFQRRGRASLADLARDQLLSEEEAVQAVEALVSRRSLRATQTDLNGSPEYKWVGVTANGVVPPGDRELVLRPDAPPREGRLR